MVRLLIVDDDAMVREELGELLQDEGFDTVSVPGGAEALQELSKSRFDVMFTDLRMPRMSGIELLREVHARFPEVYPVMLTGYSTVETAMQALEAGAYDYVPKPFRLKQVISVLRHLEQERSFRDRWTKLSSDPAQVVRSLTESGKQLAVFVWGEGSYVGAHVVHLSEPKGSKGDPALLRIEELVQGHIQRAPTPVVLVERVDRLMRDGNEEEVLSLLSSLREACARKGGRFMVTVGPGTLEEPLLLRLRQAIRECYGAEMARSLASPVRRGLLTRLADGPVSLKDVLGAEGLEDESKAFFHLQKLRGGGLVVQSADLYRLSEMGQRAAEFLQAQASAPVPDLPTPALLVQA